MPKRATKAAPGARERSIFFVSVFAADMKGTIAKAAILRTGTWRYKGDLWKVDVPFLEKVVANFTRFKRADELALDYEHLSTDDPALRGDEAADRRAAGWTQKLELEDKGNGKAILWAFFRLVGDGLKWVRSGEYRYCSVELDPDYFHPEADAMVGPYLEAVGITNRPFVERLPGMVLLSKRVKEMFEANEESAARGSDSPFTGARADMKGDGMKLNLTKYGGPAEGTEEDLEKILAANTAKAAKAEADAKKATDDAKAAAENAGKSDEESKKLLSRIDTLEKETNEREFERIFKASKADGRSIDAEKDSMLLIFSAHVAAKTVAKFEEYATKVKPKVLATGPTGSGGHGAPEKKETATKKFMARAKELQAARADKSFANAAMDAEVENPTLAQQCRDEQTINGPMAKVAGEEVVD